MRALPPFAAKSTLISPQETRTPSFAIRGPADEADWRRLWSGYCAFYETEVSGGGDRQRPGSGMLAPGVDRSSGASPNGMVEVAGFAISVLHRRLMDHPAHAATSRTSSSPPTCEDGASPARSSRIAEALPPTGWRGSIGIRATRTTRRGGFTIVSRSRRFRPLPHNDRLASRRGTAEEGLSAVCP